MYQKIIRNTIIISNASSISYISLTYHTCLIFNLNRVDYEGVMEGYSLGPRPTPAVGGGYEMNTGCFGVRYEAKGLMEIWLGIFKKDVDLYLQYSGVDQQALMVREALCI